MAADVLVPCITMSSTAMVLYMLYWMYAMSSMRKDFNWLYNIIVEIWLKILPIFTKIDLSQEVLNGTVCPSLNEVIANQLVFLRETEWSVFAALHQHIWLPCWYLVVGCVFYKPEHSKIWSNFEFNRYIVYGTGARTAVVLAFYVTRSSPALLLIMRIKRS